MFCIFTLYLQVIFEVLCVAVGRYMYVRGMLPVGVGGGGGYDSCFFVWFIFICKVFCGSPVVRLIRFI